MSAPAVRLLWNGYRYFPYERALAMREVKSLAGNECVEVEGGVEVRSTSASLDELARLTYFHEMILADGTRRTPDQALLEASAWGIQPHLTGMAIEQSRRQSTRYSAHGIHDYRGKFNPQVVRAIGNILGLPRDAWILDPFCGSGTTLLEACHAGWNAAGVDLNPLGVLISNAKVGALHVPEQQMEAATELACNRLGSACATLNYDVQWSSDDMERLGGPAWRASLPRINYLEAWFPAAVLCQFAVILKHIDESVPLSLQPVFRVILSDLARCVSFQDPGDLRTRRRKERRDNYPLIPLFLQALQRKIGSIVNAQAAIGLPTSFQMAFLGDVRFPLNSLHDRSGGHVPQEFDCAITSPPYVTALPYVDTQRLSLCLLDLMKTESISNLEAEMIGTREIRDSKRNAVEQTLTSTTHATLPPSVTKLCTQMLDLAKSPADGFRRRNMPALTFAYFCDMADAMDNIRTVLKQSGVLAMIVGPNRTVLGGQCIVVDTPILLAEIASSRGWAIRETVELDTYHRFDVHQRNSIRTESLLLLEKL